MWMAGDLIADDEELGAAWWRQHGSRRSVSARSGNKEGGCDGM